MVNIFYTCNRRKSYKCNQRKFYKCNRRKFYKCNRQFQENVLVNVVYVKTILKFVVNALQ